MFVLLCASFRTGCKGFLDLASKNQFKTQKKKCPKKQNSQHCDKWQNYLFD
jgi:hypothetical protein